MSNKRLGNIADIFPADQLRDLEAAAKKLESMLRTSGDRSAVEAGLAQSFPGGFTHRDEPNALMAMAVRNGPLENLHAGKYSAWLEDDALSRVTNEEIMIMMLYASRVLGPLLKMRDEAPEIYRRYIANYNKMYCNRWERNR